MLNLNLNIIGGGIQKNNSSFDARLFYEYLQSFWSASLLSNATLTIVASGSQEYAEPRNSIIVLSGSAASQTGTYLIERTSTVDVTFQSYDFWNNVVESSFPYANVTMSLDIPAIGYSEQSYTTASLLTASFIADSKGIYDINASIVVNDNSLLLGYNTFLSTFSSSQEPYVDLDVFARNESANPFENQINASLTQTGSFKIYTSSSINVALVGDDNWNMVMTSPSNSNYPYSNVTMSLAIPELGFYEESFVTSSVITASFFSVPSGSYSVTSSITVNPVIVPFTYEVRGFGGGEVVTGSVELTGDFGIVGNVVVATGSSLTSFTYPTPFVTNSLTTITASAGVGAQTASVLVGYFDPNDIFSSTTGSLNYRVGDYSYNLFRASEPYNVLFPVSVPPTQGLVEYMVVGGGASGGNNIGGGGGAGGLLSGSFGATGNRTYIVTIGAGGATNSVEQQGGLQGSNSTVSYLSIPLNNVAYGGGAGNGNSAAGNQFGGSGGGANWNAGLTGSAGFSVAGQGNDGGDGSMVFYCNVIPNGCCFNRASGGGGGSLTTGSAPIFKSIFSGVDFYGNQPMYWGGPGGSGSLWLDGVRYAGGGGAGGHNDNGQFCSGLQQGIAFGGPGGGGNGATSAGQTPVQPGPAFAGSGTANTGGGGGGAAWGSGYFGGQGGSGVAIFRFLTSEVTASPVGSPTIYTSGSYTYYKFTSSGRIDFATI